MTEPFVSPGFCDFCHHRDDEQTFVWFCTPFMIVGPGAPDGGYEDDGRWLACRPCHERLLERDRPGLWQRAMEGFQAEAARTRVPITPNDERYGLAMFEGFWSNQTGTWAPNQEVTDDGVVMTVWSIYQGERFSRPGQFIVRPDYVLTGGGTQLGAPMLANTLDEARTFIPPGKVRMGPPEGEDPLMLECYI